MTKMVRAKGYFREMPVVTVREGELWPADDPVVQAHPDWFESLVKAKPKPPTAASAAPPVEQATAAPGEKRVTRRA
jgi:hypothetical protein